MWTETYLIGNAVMVLGRALVPIAGVAFLGWSAAKLLMIYFADTAAAYYAYLSMIALARGPAAAIASSPVDSPNDGRFAGLARAVFLPIPTLLLVGFFFGVLPLFAMIDMQDVAWRDLLADTSLWRAVLLQFALALGLILERALRKEVPLRDSSSRRLQGACIALRWVVVLFVAFMLAPGIPRVVYGPVLVATYALLTALLELAPYRALAWVARITGKAP